MYKNRMPAYSTFYFMLPKTLFFVGQCNERKDRISRASQKPSRIVKRIRRGEYECYVCTYFKKMIIVCVNVYNN